MKRKQFAAVLPALTLLTGCAANAPSEPTATDPPAATEPAVQTEAVDIVLSDDGVACASDAVYTANDIIYYESGRGESCGDGDEADAHTPEEAAAHTVVHITAPGVYRVTGTLSAGQLFVDLGEDAKSDPNARVTLLLDDAQLTCIVAPAIFFYRVYECAPGEDFTLTPDLTDAGAVVALADGSFNLANGAYVARIYREGTEEKLHKYDGAVYSRMSMRIEGDTGSLTINAMNEGLDSERHLEINGGSLTIAAQDDGINTNADGLSVTTINGGMLSIAGGRGEEGDGIDSNGALVINGGTVFASANERSGDGGLDANCGIYLNGGTVVATGSRNDSAENASKQQFMELSFAQMVQQGSTLYIKNGDTVLLEDTVTRPFTSLTFSVPELETGVAYTVTVNGVVQQHGAGRFPEGMDLEPPTEGRGPGEFEIPEPPGGMDQPVISVEGVPNDAQPAAANGDRPTPPTKPDGEPPEKPDGEPPAKPDGDKLVRPDGETAVSHDFTLTETTHSFRNVRDAE